MAEPPPVRPTVLTVDLDAVRRNASRLRAVAAGAALLAVVKADAYGHGAVPVARALAADGGADWFGVALVEEGAQLRAAGLDAPVLILGAAFPDQAERLVALGLTPALYGHDLARALEAVAASAGRPVGVHLKADSGMGRLGFRPEELGAALDLLRGCPHLRVEGFFSNLASADDPESPQTADQVRRFGEMLEAVRAAGHDPLWVDLANSAGLLAHPASRLKMVRPGLALYGLRPSDALPDIGLEPAAVFRTVLAQVKRLPPGTPVGYSATYVTPRDQRVGVLPVGYADGLPRSAGGGRGQVLVRGARCPLLGRVSMDLCAVDLDPAGPVEPGEPVTLWGADGAERLTPWDWARWAGTIPYEVTVHVGGRVTRRYLLEGEEQWVLPTDGGWRPPSP